MAVDIALVCSEPWCRDDGGNLLSFLNELQTCGEAILNAALLNG